MLPSRTGNLTIALVGGANSGKTTFARTLLRQPVGIVGDRINVTTKVTPYADDELGLTVVDCPGFQDPGSYFAYRVTLKHSLEAAKEIKGETDFTYDDLAVEALKSSDVAVYIAPLDDVPRESHRKELLIITENSTAIALLNKRKATEKSLGVGAVNERERQWRATLAEFRVQAIDYDAHVASPTALTGVFELLRSKADNTLAFRLDQYIKARERRRAERRGQVAEKLAADLKTLRATTIERSIARSEYEKAQAQGRLSELAREMIRKRLDEVVNQKLAEFIAHCSEAFGFQPASNVTSDLEATEVVTQFDSGSGGAAAAFGLGGAYVGAHVGGIGAGLVAGFFGFLIGGPVGAAAAFGTASLWGAGAGAAGGAALGISTGLQGDSEAKATFRFRDAELLSYACKSISWATALAYHGFGKDMLVSEDEATALKNAVATELLRTRPADLTTATEEALTRWLERSLEALEV